MTVLDRIREHARPFAPKPAVIDGPRALTHAELYDRVDRLSDALAELGIRKGDTVLAFLQNAHEAIECELACLQSGIVWVTLNARLTWAEVRGVVVECRPKVLVTTETGRQQIERGLRELSVDPLPRIVVTRREGTSGDGGLASPFLYETLIGSAVPRRPDVDIADGDVARLRYTSGTTGSAKAAILSHRVYQASLDNLLTELHPLTERDRALHAAPLTHGSGALVYPMLWAGGANVLVDRFRVEEVLELIEVERITTMFTVPTILTRLISSPSFTSRDLSSLESLIYGGAPMPEHQLRPAVERIGHALLHIYGMTEAPWPITTLPQSEHRLDNPHLRSIGKPTTVCEVRIVDEAGNEVGPGVVGEIQVRGRNVMSGYYQDEAATRAVLGDDGWLASGDLGRRDGDGYIYIVDRKKDVIISGGFNVYAKEVEMALCENDRVLEAAVLGIPHPDWGELVAAFVVPKPGVTLTVSEIETFCRSRLSGYKCPRRIELLSELPKNPSGKVLKPQLVSRHGLRSS